LSKNKSFIDLVLMWLAMVRGALKSYRERQIAAFSKFGLSTKK